MWMVERCDELDFLGAEFRELYDRSSATLFQHPTWLHHVYAELAGRAAADRVIVTIRSADLNRLVAVLPLVRRRGAARRIEFADLGVSDYTGPVIDRSVAPQLLADPEVQRAIRRAIGRSGLLRFDKISGDATEVATLMGARRIVRHDYDAHAIELTTSFETWRQTRDPGFIRHVDNVRKRAGRRKRVLALRELTDAGEIDEAFALMRQFRRARFDGRRAIDLMQDDRYYDFYLKVAQHSARDGGPGSTVVLTLNDETVGVSFGMSDDERDVFVLIGYDIERYRNFSLGLIFVEELIKVSIDNNKRFHDLTLGHDAYKTSFGATATPMYSARRPLNPVGWMAQLAADYEADARRTAKKLLAYRDQRLARSAARKSTQKAVSDAAVTDSAPEKSH